ncbi:MAG: hypothetical protein ACI8UZ_000973, partial [Akkermansiaceae bacterium]
VYEQVVEGKEEVASSGANLVDMQVSHGSAALVDLGRVSNMVHMQLASAQQSRVPPIILATAAVLALGALAIWALNAEGEDLNEKQPDQVVIVAEDEPETALEKPVVAKTNPADPDTRMAKVETPEPLPEPKKEMPERPVEPDPVDPEPKPEPVVEKEAMKVASWRMDEGGEGKSLFDESREVELLPIANGRAIGAIAPDPVPLTQKENKSALQVGIWQEANAGAVFGLTADQSFTFEGWFLTGKFRRPIFLLGTRTGDEDKTGWHLDLRPPSGREKKGQMSFYYDSGGNQVFALAEAVIVADLKPHHFAVIWDHDVSREGGEMRLYLDGAEVAMTPLRHSDISGKQINPFRIGAKGNPKRLALDELRFSRRALAPQEFLLKTPVLGIKMVKSDAGNRESWGVAENWEGGVIPGASDNIIIEEGVTAQAQKSPPSSYTGSLVLKKNATLILWDDESLAAVPKAPAILVMYEKSRLILRAGDASFGPIELKEDAQIWGGDSTSGHRAVRHFTGEIKGAGKLTINGVNNNQIRFEAANSFTGGFRAHSSQNQAYMVIGSSNQAFGKGDVTIENNCSLIVDQQTGDTIADHATLYLDGAGVLKVNGGDDLYKMLLSSSETVAGFFIDGKDQGEGVFSSETHPMIGGSGKLTVKASDDN